MYDVCEGAEMIINKTTVIYLNRCIFYYIFYKIG